MKRTPPPFHLLGIAVICFVLFLICMSVLGCSSPTAPSLTTRLSWAPAPGCTPGSLPSPLPSGPAITTIQYPGSSVLTAAWIVNGQVVKGTFHQWVGNTYLLCSWEKA